MSKYETTFSVSVTLKEEGGIEVKVSDLGEGSEFFAEEMSFTLIALSRMAPMVYAYLSEKHKKYQAGFSTEISFSFEDVPELEDVVAIEMKASDLAGGLLVSICDLYETDKDEFKQILKGGK